MYKNRNKLQEIREIKVFWTGVLHEVEWNGDWMIMR